MDGWMDGRTKGGRNGWMDGLIDWIRVESDVMMCGPLAQLSVHPVPESFIHTIEDFAFKNFKQQETLKER